MTLFTGKLDCLFDESWDIFFDDTILKKVFLAIFISVEDISLSQIAEKTKLSLASVSNKTNMLAAVGLVVKKRKEGSRQVYFSAKSDFIEIMRSSVLNKDKVLNQIRSRLKDFVSEQSKASLSVIEKKELERLRLLETQLKKVSDVHKKVVRLLND